MALTSEFVQEVGGSLSSHPQAGRRGWGEAGRYFLFGNLIFETRCLQYREKRGTVGFVSLNSPCFLFQRFHLY